MLKKIFMFVMVLFLFSLVAAHGDYHDDFEYKEKFSATKYYPHENLVLSKTTYVNYDNDNRHSTYDYRHGYSYRSTSDYWDEHYFDKRVSLDYVEYVDYRDRDYYRDDRNYYRDGDWRGNKDYYYEYIPYLKSYERRDCYHDAPRDRLFYVKCP